MAQYTEDNIRSLDWKEHIQQRPGMYIGKLGNGNSHDDGIYVLLKEVIDNSIDEFVMGMGSRIDITVEPEGLTIRDYGRGIPLGKLEDCVSKINTGGKYDNKAFKKSVGLNGVGLKAVNALSTHFKVAAFRDGETRALLYSQGNKLEDTDVNSSADKSGTHIEFKPDNGIFEGYQFRLDIIEEMVKNYAYLNPGLKLYLNGEKYESKDGLKELLNDRLDDKILYPIVHLKTHDCEIAFTHSQTRYNEQYHSFVNGQNTTQGGTHLQAFKEALVKVLREFYGKNYDPADIRKSIVSAVSVKVEDPVFESQTKTKLGSKDMGPEGPTVNTFVLNFLKNDLDDFLHKNKETADAIRLKIIASERERKDLQGIRKLASERAKKASLHNKKLRDCKQHYNNEKHARKDETTIFITEGDSASGSITKSRDVQTQAVFSLKGKPLNSFGLGKKVVYENEEFNLLQAALNIEDGLENLRYNNIVIATDADVDGMHIRLLMLTFILQFFPELIEQGHVYILETPLFRVRNKKETHYCYSDAEKDKQANKLKGQVEITRFKGLGEISPDEFSGFIGKDIRLSPVLIPKEMSTAELLEYYMGKNTPDRKDFIVDNLRIDIE